MFAHTLSNSLFYLAYVMNLNLNRAELRIASLLGLCFLQNVAPERIDLTSASGALSLPICVHPKKAVFKGTSVNAASSYTCQ